MVLGVAAIASCSLYVVTVTTTATDRAAVSDGPYQLRAAELTADDLLSRVEVQARRQRRIKDVCDFLWLESNRTALHPSSLDHIIVDDQHRLLYCYVPKVACTNWKRVLMTLNGNGGQHPLDIPANDSHGQHVFRTLDLYTPAEIQHRIEHYLKFVFVRHPFERLVSAFRNKFQQNYSVYFQNRFGRLIIQRYRTNPSQVSLERGHDVTFREFVRYLLDTETQRDGPLNEHWRPAFDLCRPCQINYDVVGKYETLERDADFVLGKIAGAGRRLSFPRINKTVNTFRLMNELLANVSQEEAFKLYQLYALDFKMFDYHYSDFDKYLPD